MAAQKQDGRLAARATRGERDAGRVRLGALGVRAASHQADTGQDQVRAGSALL